ncbi:Bug family tripartite tricarboxylate transporter substrate binding protein [Roseomonas xinghualingensis]|uniref:Bug family tripartite tricarboxylate transporter substrate binding protein n=1 Tax=Roseomonas xinghualingensis TaxID=2986475 RepID=UPI0021F1ECFE|nr:tripartite tricarboxylate transporter substrate binding protein [Roseomonas sp. SXEYE001]MCV4209801.1 tripartite tricarboxylate transporter substrate binding protein [Roseomonas sp. SXEYE001]
MPIPRRALGLLACATLMPAAAIAQVVNYPNRVVRLVVPYPPGGATDVIGRMIAERLTQGWGQTVVVENRAGAGATLGAEAVARSEPDGYTLFETTSAHTISKSLYRRLSYDPIGDFTAITLTAIVPLVLVTSKKVMARDLPEFVAWAKRQRRGVTVGSTGNGTAQHLTSELFKLRAQIASEHVPYRGDAPLITDILAGQVDCSFCTLSAVLPYIKSGEMNAIALAHPRRMGAIQNVPTFAEAGMADFEAATWFGTFAPARLPEELRTKIARDISAIVAEPDFTRRLVEMGADVTNYGPERFDQFIAAETARWAEAVRVSGATIN